MCWARICMRNMLHIYLFKGLHSQSVGLWYSPPFLFLLFLCHFWQLVVDPTVRNWKKKSGARIWCQKPEGGPAMPTARQALFLRQTKAGRENPDSLINCPYILSLFTLRGQIRQSSVFFCSCLFCLKKKERKKRKHNGQSPYDQVPFLIRRRSNKKAFHSPVIQTNTKSMRGGGCRLCLPFLQCITKMHAIDCAQKKRLKWTKKSRTHRLDLSCISRPDIDLSLGLKRLSRTHTRTNNKWELICMELLNMLHPC